MGVGLLFLLFVFSSKLEKTVDAVTPTDLSCNGTTLHALRIQDCDEQPCTIRKGERLPFEIDLSFTRPTRCANRMGFDIFISYYAVPPSYYGSYLSSASCEDRNLGFRCPARANTRYTLKNSIFIDERSNCTAGCDEMNSDGTGVRETWWSWSISNSRRSDTGNANIAKQSSSSSYCSFKVSLNITA